MAPADPTQAPPPADGPVTGTTADKADWRRQKTLRVKMVRPHDLGELPPDAVATVPETRFDLAQVAPGRPREPAEPLPAELQTVRMRLPDFER